MTFSPVRLVEHARSSEGRKQLRYLGVSLVFVPVGQVLIQLLARPLDSFTSASLVAAALVAGVVGEMLTELFLLHAESQRTSASLAALATTLRSHARAFGEGLQLTNILKDRGEDAAEERHFVPEAVELRSLFALARSDLRDAARYVGALVTARLPEGLVAFTALPVRLAIDTLQAVEARGAGAKVGREQLQLALEEVGQLVRGEKSLEAVLRLVPAAAGQPG